MRAAVVAALLVGLGCGGAPGGRLATPPLRLELPTADGAEIDLDRLRGRIVVVHVFATWSLAAQSDVTQLNAVASRNAVAVVGVAVDLTGSFVVPPWVRGSGARYPVALASEDVRAGRSGIGAVDRVPMTLILDRRGVIARRHVGPLPAGELAHWIDQLK